MMAPQNLNIYLEKARAEAAGATKRSVNAHYFITGIVHDDHLKRSYCTETLASTTVILCKLRVS